MDLQLNERLDRVTDKLRRLRVLDQEFTLFGASSHEYRLRLPLSPNELANYEKRLGVRLPEEYRLFVTRVGEEGAGPYYGLFPLDGSDPEDITDLERIQKPFQWTSAFNPYDWDEPCKREDVWCDDDVVEGAEPQVTLLVPGVLYICHSGCAIRFFLIVKGECLGEVWRDSQADDAGVMPECDARGRHMGFLDWYENWLDKGIAAKATSE